MTETNSRVSSMRVLGGGLGCQKLCTTCACQDTYAIEGGQRRRCISKQSPLFMIFKEEGKKPVAKCDCWRDNGVRYEKKEETK